jgi:hypothetical protein
MQLHLFHLQTLSPGEPEPSARFARHEWEPQPCDDLAAKRTQLDLFSQRTLRLAPAWAALTEGKIDDALRLITGLKAHFPDDVEIARQTAAVARLRRRLAKAMALAATARAQAIHALAQTFTSTTQPWASLRCFLLRRVAEELGRQGETAELEGQPPGAYLLEAGALTEAQASLARTVAIRRSARNLFLLADATFLLGDEHAARRLYFEALLQNPFDAALGSARDIEVRALPDVVRYDLEIEEEPAAWSAPAGVVLGVLPRPIAEPSASDPPHGTMLAADPAAGNPCEGSAELTPRQREALARAHYFMEALVKASSPEWRRDSAAIIEARRTMKRLAPSLFTAYLERMVRTRGA